MKVQGISMLVHTIQAVRVTTMSERAEGVA